MLLEHKNAVIHGAGGAIGGAVARAFAREGARVYLAGRTLATLDAAASETIAAGGAAHAAQVDALDESAVERHIEELARKAGRIDVLFNAIGLEDDIQGTASRSCQAATQASSATACTGRSSYGRVCDPARLWRNVGFQP